MAESSLNKKPKTFNLTMSERCYRFKPDALMSHAPKQPGVYEFITFDENRKAKVLFVGLALPGKGETIFDALAAHMKGDLKPTTEELFNTAKDIYFDYIHQADISTPEDLKDIAGQLIVQQKPTLNPPGDIPTSGKYSDIKLVGLE